MMRQKSRSSNRPLAAWLLLALIAPVIAADLGVGRWDVALAQDDDGDDGDDGDDDDDDDDDDRSEPSEPLSKDDAETKVSRRGTASRAARLQAAPSPRPDFAPEIVIPDLSATDLAVLLSAGFTLVEQRSITNLAITLDRLAPPSGVSLDAALDQVRRLPSGLDADFNHFYRSSQAEVGVAKQLLSCTHANCAAWQQVGWPQSRAGTDHCPISTTIGLIDTGINPHHETLAGADLELLQLASPKPASGAVHGTAVASLLVGEKDTRVRGLLPGAEVLAVDVFSRVEGDERAEVIDLVEGLDLLAARQVRIYNLSLSGPPNRVLSRVIDRMTDEAGLDAVIVSAAGNAGPAADPAWPGAHPKVVSVTAVDTRGRVFGAAQRGSHIGLAAPGVNLLAATSISGARGKSGTSFAVPFVSAAAALLLSRPTKVAGLDVRATLFDTALDLGAPGRDPVFGYGLLSASTFCPAGLE